MQNRLKAAVFGAALALGLFAAIPVLAQTHYGQSYYYPQYTQPTYTSAYYPGYSTCPVISYNLTRGSSDYNTAGQVSSLQRFLATRYGDTRIVTGYYDSLTVYYVQRFQVETGVYPATGGVGPLTRAAIQRTCQSYNPYPNYSTNKPSTTFRLERNFSLSEGHSARLSGGQLEIYLTDVDSRDDEVRITVGLACSSGTYCIYYQNRSYTLEQGDELKFQGYGIKVVTVSSSKATLRVEDLDDGDDDDDDNDDATIEITSPDGGDEVEQGDEMDIEWTVDEEPSDASVILELYDEDDDRVGTIAIVDADDGDYEWDVPERGDICTAQFPNGLCGYDLDGTYYVKATLKEDEDGSGDTLDTDKSEEFEIED